MRDVVLIIHNVRSCHNVGSLLRTAEGLGVQRVFITGFTPYPAGKVGDERMPHIANRVDAQISKTALGSQDMVVWQQLDIDSALAELASAGYQIVALEQTLHAVPLHQFVPTTHTALVVGNEVEGINVELLSRIPHHIAIPMQGSKESFNVVQAAAMALFHIRFTP